MAEKNKYYLGLDIGTNSVGYAVTDEQYNLMRFHGSDAWGVTVFDEGALLQERRIFRTARRRLERKKQRVALLQELFAEEISDIDPDFFRRLRESALYREDAGDDFPIFNDADYTDVDYHNDYPTIHHLIVDLMNNPEPHDVRLVYLACSWLVSHRGHFLSNIDINNLSEMTSIDSAYNDYMSFFEANGYEKPWREEICIEDFADAMKANLRVTAKESRIKAVVLGKGKPASNGTEEFPFSQAKIIKLLAGGSTKLSDLFCNPDYADLGSVCLNYDDDKFSDISGKLNDIEYELLKRLRKIYDWALLSDLLKESSSISAAKVAIYEQHKADLEFLKYFVKKYCPKKYDSIFRDFGKENYVAYVYHTDDSTAKLKKADKEGFSKYVAGITKTISPDEKDIDKYNDMQTRLELCTFMPKQKDTDNRIIPNQLYYYELREILKQAEQYLPFLSQTGDNGMSTAEKILSIFTFRIPYYVGPLNKASDKAWIERKPGKIYPWNFEQMVDLDKSEEAFIKKLIGKCTYLPDQDVLPKDSLLYHKYEVLNEINNLRINGIRVSVDLKQQIYNDVFCAKKKITPKCLSNYLICNNVIERGNEESISGIDLTIKSNLEPQIAFRRLLESGTLCEADAEAIIQRSTFAEDKSRFRHWLDNQYPNLTEDDKKYLTKQKWKDFGRLSRAFLTEIIGTDKTTGETFSIIEALWNTQCNLMELLSDRFTFRDEIEKYQKEYYAEHPHKLSDRMDDMYLSNTVKRQVFRTLDVVRDIKKAFGPPEKIFIEMARGGGADQKGVRTKSRKQQLMELYDACKDEDVRHLRQQLEAMRQQLEAMGDAADNKLQAKNLFLYYLQLGKCMYTGEPIELSELASGKYNIDHIYPQAYVKDDSIINNMVLVKSEVNGSKTDAYPVPAEIRANMSEHWKCLRIIGLISDEKYRRLTRSTGFTDDEKLAFINRQLTETSQSTKAAATLLKKLFPNTEIVYCKARLTSEFRQEFELPKSRTFNDLHHAVDAYLNIVTGNVYNMKFTKNFNIHSNYSIKTRTLFTHPVVSGGQTVWNGEDMLSEVKKTAVKNTAHFTKYAFFKKGGLFAQMPVAAAEGLVPRKKDLPTEKYGGYNSARVMFFIPVKYTAGKKSEVFILPVELLHGKKFLADESFAHEYAMNRLERILGKPVDSVSFPMGMRPWKINTVLSLDGFRVCITGSSGKGKCLIAQPIMQFATDSFWQFYMKKLEMLGEKVMFIFGNTHELLEFSERHAFPEVNYGATANKDGAVQYGGKDGSVFLDASEQADTKELLGLGTKIFVQQTPTYKRVELESL